VRCRRLGGLGEGKFSSGSWEQLGVLSGRAFRRKKK